MSEADEVRQVVLDAIGYRIVECCASCLHFAPMDYRGRNAVPIRTRLSGQCNAPSVHATADAIITPREVTLVDVHGTGCCDRWEAEPQTIAVANPRATVHSQPPLLLAKTGEQLANELVTRVREAAQTPRPEVTAMRGVTMRPARINCGRCGLKVARAYNESSESGLCDACTAYVRSR